MFEFKKQNQQQMYVKQTNFVWDEVALIIIFFFVIFYISLIISVNCHIGIKHEMKTSGPMDQFNQIKKKKKKINKKLLDEL